MPVVLAAVAVGGGILARWRSQPGEPSPWRDWRRALTEARSRAEAERILTAARQECDALVAAGAAPASRALRFHLRGAILPGVALYRALLAEHSGDRQAAFAEMEALPPSSVMAPMRAGMRLLARLPNRWATFGAVTRGVMRAGFPAEGWDVRWRDEGSQCIAFDVSRCFYLDTLASYGVRELTPLYCRSDDLLMALLPPTITWERSGTLGRGQDRCDFCWRHHPAGGAIA